MVRRERDGISQQSLDTKLTERWSLYESGTVSYRFASGIRCRNLVSHFPERASIRCGKVHTRYLYVSVDLPGCSRCDFHGLQSHSVFVVWIWLESDIRLRVAVLFRTLSTNAMLVSPQPVYAETQPSSHVPRYPQFAQASTATTVFIEI